MTPLTFMRAIALGGKDGAGKLDLTLHELAALAVFVLRSNAAGECYITRARLAVDARMSEGASFEAVRGLIRKGVIDKVDRRSPEGRQAAPLFRLLFGAASCHAVTPGEDTSSRQDVTPGPAVTSRHGEGGPAVTGEGRQPSPGDGISIEEDQRRRSEEEGRARAREIEMPKAESREGIPANIWSLHGTDYIEAYENAVRRESGDALWAMPPFGERDLQLLLRTRCVGSEREDPCAWIRRTLADYARWRRSLSTGRTPGFDPRVVIDFCARRAEKSKREPKTPYHTEWKAPWETAAAEPAEPSQRRAPGRTDDDPT